MTDVGPGRVWYVSYGSNMRPEGLRRYLPRPVPAADARWLWLPHPLYFAGESARWQGGVGFLGLAAGTNRTSRGRAYRLADAEFRSIAAAENGVPHIPWFPDLRGIPVGGWAPLPVSPDTRPTRAKYNAVLRLDDMDGLPAVTLTAGRELPLRPPGEHYLAAVRAGLLDNGDLRDIDGYLADACMRSAGGSNADAYLVPPHR